MESYAEWRQRLIATNLPHPCKVVLNKLWQVTDGGGTGANPNWAQDLVAGTAMTPEVILKHLNHAFKKRWVGAKRYIYGIPITDIYAFYVFTAPVVVPQKPKPTKVRNVKESGLITLQDWEKKNGVLSGLMLQSWGNSHKLDMRQVCLLIEEFRIEMMAKEKKYKDFRMTFMTWLTKGYLSKKMEQVKLGTGSSTSSVRRSTPGHSI